MDLAIRRVPLKGAGTKLNRRFLGGCGSLAGTDEDVLDEPDELGRSEARGRDSSATPFPFVVVVITADGAFECKCTDESMNDDDSLLLAKGSVVRFDVLLDMGTYESCCRRSTWSAWPT